MESPRKILRLVIQAEYNDKNIEAMAWLLEHSKAFVNEGNIVGFSSVKAENVFCVECNVQDF